MLESLIKRVALRSSERRTQIDMGNLSVPKIAVPLDETNARASEKQLGFALPNLLTQLYSSIGNGGFGPGYGMLGVVGGAADD